MKLSIITINLNNKDGLQKTIDSVLSQTFNDFEWIVIDGGSTDGSKELIEQYADRFAYWVSEPDKGIYNAMNKGVKVAQGEYLQFLNSGDWLWSADVLSKAFAEKAADDILYGDYQMWSEEIGNYEEEKTPENLTFSFLVHRWLGHGASFIRREVIMDRRYDEQLRIASDWKFFIECALDNKSFRHVPVVVVGYGKNGISVIDQESVTKERAEVMARVVSPLIMRDLQIKEDYESDSKLMELRKYKAQSKSNRRMIHLTLRVLRLLDRFKRSKK